MVLCHFLEANRDKYNLAGKNVIELGAGTGLVTIVSSLLGTESKEKKNPVICFDIFIVFSVFGHVCISFPLTLNSTIFLRCKGNVH